MNCPVCQKDFEPSVPRQKYCSKACGIWAGRNLKPKPPREPFEFDCAHCGKHVVTAPYNDQRYVYCSHRCQRRAHEQRKELRRRKLRGNNGVSGGMSLGSLIRRERRSLD